MYTQDIIIILDACRFDYFQKAVNPFEGTLSKKHTGVPTTFDWYKKYWQEKTDRILVTENPQPYHKGSNKAYLNFKESYQTFGLSWLKVDPFKTLEKFKEIKKPNEKYLIHFLPPHLPFFFGEGGKLMKKLKYNHLSIYEVVQAWAQQKNWKLARQYYQEQINGMLNLLWDNLDVFADYETMLITSDHGDWIADNGDSIYAHLPNPPERHKEVLFNVPKFEVNIFENLLNKQLQFLGYLDK